MFWKTGPFVTVIKVIGMTFDLIALWFYRVSMALLVGLMFLTTVDVIGRFFGHAVLGSYQISELVQVWILCLAWPLSMKLNTHVSVEFFASRFPEAMKKATQCLSHILVLCVFILLFWQGMKNVILSRDIGDFVSIIEIPLYPFKLAVPIGAIVACPVVLLAIARSFSNKRRDAGGEI